MGDEDTSVDRLTIWQRCAKAAEMVISDAKRELQESPRAAVLGEDGLCVLRTLWSGGA